LAVRRERAGLGAGDSVTWRDDVPAGLLHFERPGFACTVNTTGTAVRIPAPGAVLLASSPVTVADGEIELPADCTVWWAA
ncbi:alpha-glucosidase, partial [Streptomyces sp. NPDC046716]